MNAFALLLNGSFRLTLLVLVASSLSSAGSARALDFTGITAGQVLEPAKASLGLRQQHLNRGKALAATGLHGEAVVQFEKVLAADANHAEAHNEVAWIYATCPDVKRRDTDKALLHARRAVDLAQMHDAQARPYYLLTLAAAEVEAGNIFQALAQRYLAVGSVPAPRQVEFDQRCSELALKMYLPQIAPTSFEADCGCGQVPQGVKP
ncbi:MAG: hypothetical protein K8U03_25815 [Planctomycetia bacterium]|nr:hypothetical protein [Planctomycetia bacterium]